MLLRGFLAAFREPNLPTALLACRGHFETTGTLGYLLLSMGRFEGKEIDRSEMQSVIERLSRGSKVDFEDDFTKVDPVNVLTQIDSIDKLAAKGVIAHTESYREGYDLLCEYAHPNSSALILGLEALAAGDVEFRFPPQESGIAAATALMMRRSEQVLISVYDALAALPSLAIPADHE